MINCGSCAFWDRTTPHQAPLLDDVGPHYGERPEETTAREEGVAEAVASFGACTAINMGSIAYRPGQVPLALVREYDDYWATGQPLYTRAEFGCALGEAATSGRPTD